MAVPLAYRLSSKLLRRDDNVSWICLLLRYSGGEQCRDWNHLFHIGGTGTPGSKRSRPCSKPFENILPKGTEKMTDERKTYVVNLLETYHTRAQQIALLHYELKHPAHISPDEMIGTMNMAHGGEGSGHASGHVSDKTLYIALNYRDKADALNADVLSDTAARLTELEQEQDRLVYYVSLLDKRQTDVIRLSYFESLNQAEVADELGLGIRSVQTIKAQAINALTEMYAFTSELN